ncbi:MAG: hypothetical protein EA379_05055 [Phycisphaerales bacterium]|nr:MAG: hypothetical protein EA379_05055 [Phycisphaerales bacterium]
MLEIMLWVVTPCLMIAGMTIGMVESTRIVFARARRTRDAKRVEVWLRAWWVFLPLTLLFSIMTSGMLTMMWWPGALACSLLSTIVVAATTGSPRVVVFTFVGFAPLTLTQFVFETSGPYRNARIDPLLIWLGLTACSIGFLVLAYGVGLRSWARRVFPPAVCPECGYDVRGLPHDVCPECGTEGVVAQVVQ